MSITLRTAQSAAYILEADPALDKMSGAYDRKRYLETLDPAFAPLREGEAATVFLLRRLTRKQFLHVLRQAKADQLHEAVAYGVREVANLTDDRGTSVRLEVQKEGDLGERLTAASMDLLCTPELLLELGERVLALSTLGPLAGSP